ncbi:MAG: hypothetical protein KDD82_29475, partial [Planctomycetes bacterium]|nr:hypothetical protein [Planctomycetota bacterium]
RRGDQGVARLREVGLGPQQLGDAVEVRSGLQVGDELIVSPPPGLSEDARVAVRGEAGEAQ